MGGKRTVLVVGAGAVGSRRAAIAACHPRSELVGVCDLDRARAAAAAAGTGAVAHGDWLSALQHHRPELVVVCTPVREQMPIGQAALQAGADVLLEKPFGRSLAEARALHAAAARAGRRVAVGFNHRCHEALARAVELAHQGAVGALHFVRCIYGHGGRPGYEREWRADQELAGGGELLDQGSHVLDLLHWLLGPPCSAYAELPTLAWPMAVEDNAFALLRYAGGQVASFHASWSQWQNRFRLEIYGASGAVEVDGLGGSYGRSEVALLERRPGAPPLRAKSSCRPATSPPRAGRGIGISSCRHSTRAPSRRARRRKRSR
jgi:predicted dehydrogenase